MICKTCGITKNESEFRKYRKTCKTCEKEYNRKWCSENKDKVRLHNKKAHSKRKEKDDVLKKAWYERNKERLLVKNKEYQSKLPKTQKSNYQKKYYKSAKTKIAIKNKEYRFKNSEILAKRSRKYVEELADCYLKTNLANKGFDRELITNEIIEVQRLIIKTKRLCKTLQN